MVIKHQKLVIDNLLQSRVKKSLKIARDPLFDMNLADES